MSQKSNEEPGDEMRAAYDFSGGVRGKYYQQYMQGTNVVLLEPDVAEAFHDSESVNRALRILMSLASDELIHSLSERTADDPGKTINR